MAQNQHLLALPHPEWRGELVEIIKHCLREKRSRIETLRLVRAGFGEDFPEAEVRQLLEEQLMRRYQSAIFCATVLARNGWKETRQLLSISEINQRKIS